MSCLVHWCAHIWYLRYRDLLFDWSLLHTERSRCVIALSVTSLSTPSQLHIRWDSDNTTWGLINDKTPPRRTLVEVQAKRWQNYKYWGKIKRMRIIWTSCHEGSIDDIKKKKNLKRHLNKDDECDQDITWSRLIEEIILKRCIHLALSLIHILTLPTILRV